MDKCPSEQDSMQLNLLCRNSGAVHLVQPSLMTGWLAGWQDDEMYVGKFQIYKICYRLNFLNFLLCLIKLQHYYSNMHMNAFKLVFSAKVCFKVVVRSAKIGKAIVFLVDPYY